MMDLFGLPVEIRLVIYSELLVCPAPLILTTSNYPSPEHLWVEGTIDLYPAILRTNKQIYNEAVSLLYSDNCFQFPKEDKETIGFATGTTLTLFLAKIGPRASLLRHVCVSISNYSTSLGSAQLHEGQVKDLDLLRDACIGVTTLKLSLSFTSGFPVSTATLDMIDTRLKAIPSLQSVIVNVEWHVGDSVGASDDEEEDLGGVDDWDHPGGSLAAKLRERGWTVQITKIHPGWSDYEDEINDFLDDTWSRRGWDSEQEDDDHYYRQRQLEAYGMDFADDGGPS
ncbi:hypothetical protein B0T16DRAFT_244710 [Cercophora newfieldiana]|uniref:Uncharacterized protein n=1 Tax=Cercophora newfieldiana TaxID=92897 RepID=A0AA39XSK6_9PEZI|nr:hypothetical protein B0T16DRAFT_244710 [Cercophora newfieldiana]